MSEVSPAEEVVIHTTDGASALYVNGLVTAVSSDLGAVALEALKAVGVEVVDDVDFLLGREIPADEDALAETVADSLMAVGEFLERRAKVANLREMAAKLEAEADEIEASLAVTAAGPTVPAADDADGGDE